MKDPMGHGSAARFQDHPAPGATQSGNSYSTLRPSGRPAYAGGQPVSSNAAAAQALMGKLMGTQAPIHPGMLLRSARDS